MALAEDILRVGVCGDLHLDCPDEYLATEGPEMRLLDTIHPLQLTDLNEENGTSRGQE